MSSSSGAEWYYSTSGESTGPVSVEELRRLVAQGAIRPAHYVRHAGWDRWWSVNDAAAVLQIDVGSLVPLPGAQPSAPPETDSELPDAAGDAASRGTQATHSPDEAGSTPVTFARRVTSWLIDGSVLLAAMVTFNTVFAGQPALATLFLVAGYVGYTFGLRYMGHETIGHVATKLRVRDCESGEAPTWMALATRSALVALLAAPLLLGLLGVVVALYAHPRGRSWHDLASGTVVVNEVAGP